MEQEDKSPKELVYEEPELDWGDDIRDYERKEREQWNYELQNNPIYRPYMEQTFRRL
jgi:hypothetical protein